jgi:predicted metal-dependent hydrolase
MPNLPFNYSIRRSPRALKGRIIVSGDKVEVVVPTKISELRIHQFVYAKQQWVILALAKMATRSQLHKEGFFPACYDNNADIIYQGIAYKLVIRTSTLKKIKIEFTDVFIAHVPHAMMTREHSDDIKAALKNWMKKQAKLQVEHIVKIHEDKKQLTPRTINIKTQKSRWGSCGIHNDININWLLVIAPPEVLEYVVVHELCHIEIRNHSFQFWDLVAQHLPGYQSQIQWLKEHGARLMRG